LAVTTDIPAEVGQQPAILQLLEEQTPGILSLAAVAC
jgi:hypothetical protein